MLDTMSNIHDTDFYTWTQQQAALLRQGCLAQLDVVNLSEEIADMGRSERRGLESRLAVLIMHLLKWQYQATQRSNEMWGHPTPQFSWRLTIKEQRRKAQRLLRMNPGLKAEREEILLDAYGDARLHAARETGLDETTFPTLCPWSWQQLLDDDFWPGNATC